MQIMEVVMSNKTKVKIAEDYINDIEEAVICIRYGIDRITFQYIVKLTNEAIIH